VVVNPHLVKNLVEMGFPENRAKRALKFFRNNLENAMEHIMNTEEEQDDLVFGPQVAPARPT
jgi:uncharacterized UBP type Zn finger protein